MSTSSTVGEWCTTADRPTSAPTRRLHGDSSGCREPRAGPGLVPSAGTAPSPASAVRASRPHAGARISVRLNDIGIGVPRKQPGRDPVWRSAGGERRLTAAAKRTTSGAAESGLSAATAPDLDYYGWYGTRLPGQSGRRGAHEGKGGAPVRVLRRRMLACSADRGGG